MNSTRRTAAGKALVGLTVAVLLVCALGVIFVLPKFVSPPATRTAAKPEAPVAAAPSAASEAEPSAAPSLADRDKAQIILEKIHLVRDRLETARVQLWAAAAFDAAQSLVKEADDYYHKQYFTEAAAGYQRALDAFETIDKRRPEILEQALTDGAAALETGDAAGADQAFGIALALEPDSAEAGRGMERAQSLDEVRELLTTAEEQEASGDTKAAIASYQRALELDPDTAAARDAVRRLQNAATERSFRQAMSEGFAALDRGDVKKAHAAFERARRIKPKSPEVLDALRQTGYQASSAAIEQLLSEAGEFESQEKWRDAGLRYEAILKIDNKLVAAIEGQKRSAARFVLDKRLEAILAEPARLADDAVFEEVTKLHGNAGKIANPGIRLRGQLEGVGALLAGARQPVTVNLRSNNETRVTVYKIGELGQFESTTLNLIPGRYIAVGTREGYRDVRVEFQVSHSEPPPVVTVECQERISFGSS